MGGVVLSILVLLGACGGEELVSARGEIVLSPRELDFGAVWVGERVEGTLAISNDGRAPMAVGLRSSGPPFEVQASVEVPAAGEAAVKVGFRPVAAGEAAGEVRLQVEGGGKEFRTQLRGEGVSPRIFHPGSVDFGAVRVGERAVLAIALGNDTSRDMVDLRVSLSGSDAAHFAVIGELLELPAQTSGELLVAFEPGLVRSYRALLSVSACDGCPLMGIDLLGLGGESNVVASPEVLDFGPVVVGGNRERSLTIRNQGQAVARLREARIEGAGFSAPRTLAVDLGGHERFELPVRFSPWEAGDREASLTVLDETGAVVAEAELRGRGAAVELAATPAAVDLNMVPLGSSASARLTIAHAGELVAVELTGATIEGGSGWSVTAPSFPVGVGSEGVEVSVDFAATALGRSEATLVLHTSVPFQPALYVPLVARVAKDEDCRLSFLPRLRFGLVPSGRTHERALTLTNTGGRDCMVWGIELDPAGSARFSLPEPPGEAVIFSGERLEIPVTFAAEVPSLEVFTTTLRFRSSDFAAPEVEVPVSGYAPGLEVYAEPEPVDFGVTPVDRIRVSGLRAINHSLIDLEFWWVDVFPDNVVALAGECGDYWQHEVTYREFEFAVCANRGSGWAIDEAGLEFQTYFRPPAEGFHEAELGILLRGEPEPVVVRLRGEGSDGPCMEDCEPPVAICPEPMLVPTSQQVILVGSGIDPQGGPVSCYWHPAEPETLNATSPLPPYSCSAVFTAWDAGEYLLRLDAIDAQGDVGQCTTTVSAYAPPEEDGGLRVVSRGTDMTLFHSAGGPPTLDSAWALPYVCCWLTEPSPDWDQPGIVADNPYSCGETLGRDCIRIDIPAPLIEYHVGLSTYGGIPGTASTEVYCGGVLVARETTTFTDAYQRAWVGTVRFDDAGGCAWTSVGSVWDTR